MKVQELYIKNYRSIVNTEKIEFQQYTVLIGKNNEGKTNIIRALQVVVSLIHLFAKRMSVPGLKKIVDSERIRLMQPYRGRREEIDENLSYSWEHDFPKSKKNKGDKATEISVKFSLSDEENEVFWEKIHSRLNGELELDFKFYEDDTVAVSIIKKGRNKTLKSNIGQVIRFLSDQISFNYMPAVRSQSTAMSLIKHTLAQELQILETNDDYRKARELIETKQQEKLDEISERITADLKPFLQDTRAVSVESRIFRSDNFLSNSLEVRIDDGVETPLEDKGEGIKSLMSMALLNARGNRQMAQLIAIDEPESHLHPSAIKDLGVLIRGLTDDNQVIIMTHNPLFVDRNNLKSNVIISNGQAHVAHSIQEIRQTLGVEVSDNLVNAGLFVLVEGLSDKLIVRAIIRKSQKINSFLNRGLIVIDDIGGATNLKSVLQTNQRIMAQSFVVLDNDKIVDDKINQLISDGSISSVNVQLVPKTNGRKESEIENLIKDDLLIKSVASVLNLEMGDVQTVFNKYANSSEKFSRRMERIFDELGKSWIREGSTVKKAISDQFAEKSASEFLNEDGLAFQGRLIRQLERIIEERGA